MFVHASHCGLYALWLKHPSPFVHRVARKTFQRVTLGRKLLRSFAMFREVVDPTRNAMEHFRDRLNAFESSVSPLVTRINSLEDLQRDTRKTIAAHSMRLGALERAAGIETPGVPATGSDRAQDAIREAAASGSIRIPLAFAELLPRTQTPRSHTASDPDIVSLTEAPVQYVLLRLHPCICEVLIFHVPAGSACTKLGTVCE